MRVIQDAVDERLSEVTFSICKDVKSWHDWLCLVLSPKDNTSTAHIADDLFNLHLDGSAYICRDGAVVMLCRQSKQLDVRKTARDFAKSHHFQNEINMLSLRHDWTKAVASILAHVQQVVVTTNDNTGIDFTFAREIERVYPCFTDIMTYNRDKRGDRHTPTVMLVEDDPLTRRLVTSALKNQYPIITAGDAHSAMMNYMLYAPDIVFLDIDLPDGTGYNVLHELKKRDADAFVVMFSSHSYLDSIVSAVKSGARGFVPKPFDKERLMYYVYQVAA